MRENRVHMNRNTGNTKQCGDRPVNMEVQDDRMSSDGAPHNLTLLVQAAISERFSSRVQAVLEIEFWQDDLQNYQQSQQYFNAFGELIKHQLFPCRSEIWIEKGGVEKKGNLAAV